MTKPHTQNEWMPRERWEALVRGENCPLCEKCRSAEAVNDDGHLIAVMLLSHLRLWTCQYPTGSCLLVCTKHVREPYHLDADERSAFFADIMDAAEALDFVFRPAKMNFLVLGNRMPHLHVLIQPRYYGDAAPGRPIGPEDPWVTLAAEEYEERVRLTRTALDEITARIHASSREKHNRRGGK